jgi:ribulose-5-phosphate 4-epimerase/fuculose-1-phosphate aldolase
VSIGAAAGGMGFFFLHKEVIRRLQGKPTYELDYIKDQLNAARDKYLSEQAGNQKAEAKDEDRYKAYMLKPCGILSVKAALDDGVHRLWRVDSY